VNSNKPIYQIALKAASFSLDYNLCAALCCGQGAFKCNIESYNLRFKNKRSPTTWFSLPLTSRQAQPPKSYCDCYK